MPTSTHFIIRLVHDRIGLSKAVNVWEWAGPCVHQDGYCTAHTPCLCLAHSK